MFDEDIPAWAKKMLGCSLIATFGTEKTKSAILTACRGYRGPGSGYTTTGVPSGHEEVIEEYHDGIDVDEAQYMASLIPQERGFLWPIKDVVYGNEEKNRKPVTAFLHEVNKYPGLLNIITAIEGIENKRSSHASGVIFFDGDPFAHCAFMRTPKGELITQFNLHDVEYMGCTKYDFLVTAVQDKLVQTIELLQKDKLIEPDLSLREVYNKYLHPNVLPINDENIWKALANVSVLNVFQFESQVGAQVAKKLKPKNVLELSTANGLMRLMGDDNEERPIDKYARQKENIQLWYDEMEREGLSKEEQKILEPYFLPDYGVPPDQENLMLILMDKDICGFTLAEANSARKIVGKKQMNKIPDLKAKVLSQAKSLNLGEYVWKHGLGPQMGYSFSRIHALAYSFIGAQTLYIATHWPEIYWDCACLIVNSASLDDDIDVEKDDGTADDTIYDEEQTTTKKAASSTDYTKVAKALNMIQSAGIKISLIDINKSDFGFIPDAKNNQILFGMKALLNVNDDFVDEIIAKRPYTSIKDFVQKTKPKKQSMISLIKAGAFDNMMDRKKAMAWYIWETCDKKSRITLQNMPSLIKNKLLPEDTEERIMARRIYEFNRYLKAINKNIKDPSWYFIDERAINFLTSIEKEDLICAQGENPCINIKTWDKIYQNWMNVFRTWIAEDKDIILQNLNDTIFKVDWEKYALGNYSSWEMEVLCFYYHKHELADINMAKYGLSDFNTIPEAPIVDRTFKRGNNIINLYKLHKICGTCIAKNKTKSTVTILTTDGVVDVKFRKEYFALFDKQISERGADGVKHVVEKSWFNRGNMIIVQGIRSGDDFLAKKYSNSGGHQLYHIVGIEDNGDIILQTERYKGEEGE